MSGVKDASSVVYKDTQNKQKKMEELAEKLSCVQTFLFLYRFLFLLFSSSVPQVAMLQITVCCDLTRVWRVKERVF